MAAPLEQLEERVIVLERAVQELRDAMNLRRRIGMTMEDAQEFLKRSIQRTPKDIAKALSIVGIAEGGPGDVAENFRHYLYGFPKKRKDQ